MSTLEPRLRPAVPEDAVTVAALAVQVFLDTYATGGVRPDLAREAFAEYSAEAFATRLREPTRRLCLAAEQVAMAGGAGAVWLTAWEGNHRAHRFYAALGYRDIGATTNTFQGNTYPNRVFAKYLTRGDGPA